MRLEAESKKYRNGPSAREKVEFCIQQLDGADIKPTDEVVNKLTAEEIAGALLHARDELDMKETAEVSDE